MELRERIRSRVDAGEAERQSDYIEGRRILENEYNRIIDEFSRAQGQAVAEAQRTLYKGGGTEAYQKALAEASAAPDERLPELASLASQSGLADLEQAVAIVADQRKPGGTSELFRDWVAKDPAARQAAHDRLKGTPRALQFHQRTLGVKTPRADAADLEPTHADHQKAAEAKAAKDAPRREFFGSAVPEPRRQVGSRIS